MVTASNVSILPLSAGSGCPANRTVRCAIAEDWSAEVDDRFGVVEIVGGRHHVLADRLIDGVEASQKEVRTDFLDTVTVKSSGYNAEFRAATGGTVSAVTKTGSNAWHGSASFYYRNEAFNGEVRRSLDASLLLR